MKKAHILKNIGQICLAIFIVSSFLAPTVLAGEDAVILVTKLKAQAGKEAEFEAAFQKLIDKVDQEEPGTLMYRLCQSTEDSTEYVVIEEFESEEALAAHGNAPYMKEVGPAIHSATAGPAVIERFIEKSSIKR